MRISGGDDRFDFRHRHDRKEADEKEEQHGEDTKRSEEREDLDDRRRIVAPARRKEVARQRGHDDHEALEPHAYVDEQAEDPDEGGVFADGFEPEELRRNDVAA